MKTKQSYFDSPNTKKITDNKTFWKTVVPLSLKSLKNIPFFLILKKESWCSFFIRKDKLLTWRCRNSSCIIQKQASFQVSLKLMKIWCITNFGYFDHFDNVVFPSQFGFLKVYSPQHYLVIMIKKIKGAIDKGAEFEGLLSYFSPKPSTSYC